MNNLNPNSCELNMKFMRDMDINDIDRFLLLKNWLIFFFAFFNHWSQVVQDRKTVFSNSRGFFIKSIMAPASLVSNIFSKNKIKSYLQGLRLPKVIFSNQLRAQTLLEQTIVSWYFRNTLDLYYYWSKILFFRSSYRSCFSFTK